MQEGETGYSDYESIDPNFKLRDIEEKQRILKDRVLLIGKNMIETKEDNTKKILDLRKDMEIIKENLERIKIFLETMAEEFSKFATKDDLEILSKKTKILSSLE